LNTIASQVELDENDLMMIRAASLAPRPRKIAETGLSESLLGDLIEKHLYGAGVLTIPALGQRTALAGPILEDMLNYLRKDGRIEVRAQTVGENGLRYGLTERGRESAQAALLRSGYVGPAPVPLAFYSEVVRHQSVRDLRITRQGMHAKFSDVVINVGMLDRLGPALNSGKAIFVYGDPGTGKTYISQRLARLLDDEALVPHAIAVGETIIEVFNPLVHMPLDTPSVGVLLDDGYDPRFVLCRRPVVLTGGELVPEMLEVQFEPATRQFRAPLQLQASNGMFILDDLGRQRVPPQAILNRWIVPMEEGRDYLSLPNGQHFPIQFDLLLVFSTNLNPTELADDAFLRRIGYKIRFEALSPAEYHEIWKQVCAQRDIVYDSTVCQRTIDRLHLPSGTALLPCHPRDLIGMALDHSAYLGAAGELRFESLQWAWNSYFLALTDGRPSTAPDPHSETVSLP
jgi:hypothetical protein